MKLKPVVVAKLINRGRLPRELLTYLVYEEMSRKYGFSPDQIRSMKAKDIEWYKAIMLGKGARLEDEIEKETR